MNITKLCLVVIITITYSLISSPKANAITIDWSRYSSLRERIRSITPYTPRIITPAPTDTTPSPTPTRSVLPTPTSTPTPTLIHQSPSPASTVDGKKDYIMKAINTYRGSRGLDPVKTDPYTCSFAKIRAKEISTNFSHAGFNTRVSNRTLPYPGYSLVTENLAMTSNYQNVVTMWIKSPGHAENMRKNTPYVCVEYYGNYYAYEGWRP